MNNPKIKSEQGLLALNMASFWSILSLLEDNHEKLLFVGIIRSFAIGSIILVVAFFAVLAVKKLTKRSFQQVSIGASAGIIVFFMYINIMPHIGNTLYFLLLFGVTLIFGRFARNDKFATIFSITLTVPVAYLFIVMSINIGLSYFDNTLTTAQKPVTNANNYIDILRDNYSPAVIKPNVYFIIIDGYPSSDIQQKIFDIDNKTTIDTFKRYGYQVQEQAKSNYNVTHLSLASVLDANYLTTETGGLPSNIVQKFYSIVTGYSKSVQKFREFGYKYYHLGASIYTISACSKAEDLCLNKKIPFLQFIDLALIKKTPLDIWMKEILAFSGYDLPTSLKDLEIAIDELELNQETEPFFLFAHTIPPHAPFLYNADCTEREDRESIFTALNVDNKDLYRDGIICVNQQLKKLVAQIEKKDPESLVIIQSDHGSHFTVDWFKPLDKWSNNSLYERFSILSAIKAPQECKSMLSDDWININTFRFVFACLTQTKPLYLEPKFYVTTYKSGAVGYGKVHRYDTIYEELSNQ